MTSSVAFTYVPLPPLPSRIKFSITDECVCIGLKSGVSLPFASPQRRLSYIYKFRRSPRCRSSSRHCRMPRRFPELPATPRMPDGPSADPALIPHDDEYHREHTEAEAEELKLR